VLLILIAADQTTITHKTSKLNVMYNYVEVHTQKRMSIVVYGMHNLSRTTAGQLYAC